jgi:hypothetical protein
MAGEHRTHVRLRVAIIIAVLLAVLCMITWWQWGRPVKKAALPTLPPVPPVAALEPATKPVAAAPEAAAKPVEEVVAPPPLPAPSAKPPRRAEVRQPAPPAPLDLRLPPQNIAPGDISVQERRMLLPDLFSPPASTTGINIGGHLIMDDKPADKEATLRDRVKGAEVRVEVKTN